MKNANSNSRTLRSLWIIATLFGSILMSCTDKIEYSTTTYKGGTLNILLNNEKEYLFEEADITIEGDEVVFITFPDLVFDDVSISSVTVENVERIGTPDNFTLKADNVSISVEGVPGRAILDGSYKNSQLEISFKLSSAFVGLTIEGTYTHIL